MKIAICHISEQGRQIAGKLRHSLEDCEIFDLRGKGLVSRWTSENFHRFDGLIYIMSLGIVYRVIAPHITDKYNDPAVVVIDDAARFSIAALSGHEGGANRLSARAAAITGAVPVVTTASETNRKVILGVGCRKGIGAKAVRDAVTTVLDEAELQPGDVRLAVSADIKREEKGLIEAFEAMDIPLIFLDSRDIAGTGRYKNVSEAAMRQLGLPGVAEPCALLGGRGTTLIMERQVQDGVTVALAREDDDER